METNKNTAGLIALSVGIALILGAGIYGVVRLINRDKQDSQPEPFAGNLESSSNTVTQSGYDNKGFSTEQIKTMQQYLLQLGYQYNNQYIIDSIELTGGIDGVMGAGFHAAIIEARDKGYLSGYEDVLARLGY